jgi:hypothetical protein
MRDEKHANETSGYVLFFGIIGVLLAIVIGSSRDDKS